MKLDTKAQRLTKLEQEMPSKKLAHQVIYLPAKEGSPRGSVYVFGGYENLPESSKRNFRFDVATSTWHNLPSWDRIDDYVRFCFNLLPLVNF